MALAFQKASLANKDLKELEKICRPVVEYIQKNYDPHTKIIIDWSYATLVTEEIGVPFEVPD